MSLTILERKELRTKLLIDLYDHYFTFGGQSHGIRYSVMKSDPEIELAYNYLIHKGLVTLVQNDRKDYYFSITSEGIDVAEDIHPRKFEKASEN